MFGFSSKRLAKRSKPVQRTLKPQVEALEQREVMSTLLHNIAVTGITSVFVNTPPQPTAAGLALINSLANTPVQSTTLTDYQRDGCISRNDMLDILRQGSSGYTSLTTAEFSSLKTLVNNAATVDMPQYVQNLASKTLSGANAELQADIKAMKSDGLSQTIVNRFLAHENVTLAQELAGQVDNWFLGEVHPNAGYVYNGTTVTPTYQAVYLPLWNSSPTYQDVSQGAVGDCWLMASLAEVAARNPGDIMSMFVDNGDNTYTVRFFNGGTPDYVTVDNYLPNGGNLYDHPQGDMWAALAEKAYAQENGAGMVTTGHTGVDSYQALNSGWPSWALPAITGLSANLTTGVNANSVMNAWFAGSFVVLCTGGSPDSSLVVPDHCYALLNYSNTWFTVFNPWGTAGGYSGSNGKYYPGTLEVSCSVLGNNFTHWSKAGTASGVPGTQTSTISAFVQTDAKPVGTQNQTQIGFHIDNQNTFTAPTHLSAEGAMLSSLAGFRGGSTAVISDAAALEVFGNVDLF